MEDQIHEDIINTIETVENKENGIQYSLDLLDELIEIHTDDQLLLNTTLKVIQSHLLAEQFIIENFVNNVKPYLNIDK